MSAGSLVRCTWPDHCSTRASGGGSNRSMLGFSRRDSSPFLPHRYNPPKTADNVAEIFATNVAAIDRAPIVVASLNGVTTDDGTAWE